MFVINSLVKSDASRAGDDRRRGSNRGVYFNSNNSTKGEPWNLRFTIEDIYKATRNFSPSFKIGQGGFGTVYKGRLADGTFVAIKRAKKVGLKCFSSAFCFFRFYVCALAELRVNRA